jgi:predicted metalloprotease with PDZ domain
MRSSSYLVALTLWVPSVAHAQGRDADIPTQADRVRGADNPSRSWWDVTFYDLHVRANPADSSFTGWNGITSLDTVRFTASGIAVSLVLQDRGATALRPDAERVLRAGLDELTTIFNGPPRDSTGHPALRLTVNLSTGVAGEGDSDPGVLTIVAGEQPLFGFYSWRLVVLHELVHLWSAETFRYRDNREQWFNEGVAEYYMLRTATRRGFVAPETAPAIAAMAAGFYTSAPGAGHLSLREAGRTPANKREHYFLVYHGGWMAATILDVDIRRRTRGTRSLDDLMRWLYANRDARARRYALDDLIRGLKAASGLDYAAFMESYVEGKAVLPIGEYLDLGNVALGEYRHLAPLDPALAAALGLTARQARTKSNRW